MSTEKTDAIVIRLADFSESSKVVTLFTREFGKIACLAKGAKRLKSAFESGLDLLSETRIVFIQKSSTGLDLMTESQLIHRFQPVKTSLNHLYGGYYVAELLNAFTETDDPHPDLYDAAITTLDALEHPEPVGVTIITFELTILYEIGQLPDFESCTICHSTIETGEKVQFGGSQAGLICTACGQEEYEGAHSTKTQISAGAIALIRRLTASEHQLIDQLVISPSQMKEVRSVITSAISHAMGRRPKTLGMLKF